MTSRRLRAHAARPSRAGHAWLRAITRPERGQRTALRQVRQWLGLPQVDLLNCNY